MWNPDLPFELAKRRGTLVKCPADKLSPGIVNYKDTDTVGTYYCHEPKNVSDGSPYIGPERHVLPNGVTINQVGFHFRDKIKTFFSETAQKINETTKEAWNAFQTFGDNLVDFVYSVIPQIPIAALDAIFSAPTFGAGTLLVRTTYKIGRGFYKTTTFKEDFIKLHEVLFSNKDLFNNNSSFFMFNQLSGQMQTAILEFKDNFNNGKPSQDNLNKYLSSLLHGIHQRQQSVYLTDCIMKTKKDSDKYKQYIEIGKKIFNAKNYPNWELIFDNKLHNDIELISGDNVKVKGTDQEGQIIDITENDIATLKLNDSSGTIVEVQRKNLLLKDARPVGFVFECKDPNTSVWPEEITKNDTCKPPSGGSRRNRNKKRRWAKTMKRKNDRKP